MVHRGPPFGGGRIRKKRKKENKKTIRKREVQPTF